MKALPLQDNLLITWSRPKFYRAEFVLRFGKEPVGRLWFELSDPAAATAEAEDGSWKFRYTQFLSSRVSIWTSNMNFLGALELPLSKPGEMNFMDGRQFKWAACDADQKRWQLSLEENTPVLRFSQESTSWRSRGYVELTSFPMEIPDISLFCLLGCYLLNLDYSYQVGQALRRSMMDIW
jgi:hypothetical protein